MENNKTRKTNAESVADYQKKRDAIMLRPSKEDGACIRSAALHAGQSVQAYVLQAVKERMQRDGGGVT